MCYEAWSLVLGGYFLGINLIINCESGRELKTGFRPFFENITFTLNRLI